MLNVLCVILCVSETEIPLKCDAHYIVYRIPSAFPERKPYATYVHQLVKPTSFMLTKETAKGHVGLTLTICRNFEFYQNDTKIWRKLAYEMYNCVQFLGGFAPRPLDQGLCTWTPLGAQPPDPHYRLALPRSP